MVEGYDSEELKAKAERIKNKMENLDKMERRSKILGLLALICIIYAVVSYFLHSVGIWSPFDIDWLIALILYIELRVRKMENDIYKFILTKESVKEG